MPTLADISEAEQDLDNEVWPITVQEVIDRVPCDDNAYAEMLKSEEQKIPQFLRHILQDVMDNEVILDAWKRGTIIKLP